MGTIRRLGAPNRNLKASIGDIYIDLKTGNKYKCTFSYVVAGNYECDWKLVEKDTEIEKAPVVEKEVIVEEEPVIKTPVEVIEVVERVEAEPVQPVQQPQRRTDYAAYGKNKKKK